MKMIRIIIIFPVKILQKGQKRCGSIHYNIRLFTLSQVTRYNDQSVPLMILNYSHTKDLSINEPDLWWDK